MRPDVDKTKCPPADIGQRKCGEVPFLLMARKLLFTSRVLVPPRASVMSLPRQVLPETTYLITRRCAQRQFLLRPDRKVNQIFEFCLAHASERFDIRIHCHGVLSNHYHIVLTDPHGVLPEFMHWLNEYVAKCVNAHLGRWESFWAPGSYSSVRLLDRNDVVAKMVYVYTNPVDARLVARARDWPGARSLPEDLAKPAVRIERPRGFFRDRGVVPDHAYLRLTVPGALDETVHDAVKLLEQAVRDREREIARAVRAEGRRFLGKRRVLRQSPFGRPESREPRRGLNPRVAVRGKWRRIEALLRLKLFLAAYRRARLRYVDGETSVLFPVGTYWLRVRLGVLCAEP